MLVDEKTGIKYNSLNDKEPNFRMNGYLFLVRCFSCDPDGRENWKAAVAAGVCAFCGWDYDKEGRNEV